MKFLFVFIVKLILWLDWLYSSFVDLLWKLEAFQSFWEFRTSLFMSGTSTLETQSVSQPIWEVNSCSAHSGSSIGNQKHFALTGIFVVFCDPWKYFVVSSSLSFWDFNRVSPICRTVVETGFPVVPELNLSSTLGVCRHGFRWLQRQNPVFCCVVPLFCQERFSAFALPAFQTLSVRNPCINKLSLYTEPLVWGVLPLLCLVFHATSASFTVFCPNVCGKPFLPTQNRLDAWRFSACCCVNKTLIADGIL